MGRKLNLSHLNEEECQQVLAVVQRDFTIRQKEKDRMVQIQELVESEAQKRLVLSRQLEFNTKHCICCFSTFGMIFNKKVKCEKCNFFICKDCRTKTDKKEECVCLPCDQQRHLQEQACQWFYNEMKSKFRRFGSAKVVRSLYKRQTESGGSESEHNSDSGVDHPFSPLLQTKGSGPFKRGGSAEAIDEETNTESETPADSSALYAALLLKNPDWLKQYKPPSESIGVQAPDDNIGQQSGKQYWDLLGSSEGAEGRLKHGDSEESDSDLYVRRCHSRLHPKVVAPPENQPPKSKASKSSQSSNRRDNGSSSSSTNTLQPPTTKDGVCMLSPIEEVSSPESSEAQDGEASTKGRDVQKFKFPRGQEGDRGTLEATVEERLRSDGASPDSGINASSSSFEDKQSGQEDALRHRTGDEGATYSTDAMSASRRDLDDQPNSLETNVSSPLKNMRDVRAKAVFTKKYEASDRNGNVVEIESVELSCSSDDDDDDGDDKLDHVGRREPCALNFEDFMRQIQETGNTKSEMVDTKDKKKKEKNRGSKGGKKKVVQSKDDGTSSPKKKALAKRSHSTGDCRFPEKDKTPVKLSRSASNRFIRYDSLPLVVEVYEADAGSPSPSFKESPRRQRFVYDIEPESESTLDQNDSGLVVTSGSSEESKSRQASVESGTTEGTFPKSTSFSSLSSATDGDRRRSADSVALKSSFDSDYDTLTSPNHSTMRLGSSMEADAGGARSSENDDVHGGRGEREDQEGGLEGRGGEVSQGGLEETQEGQAEEVSQSSGSNLGDRRQLSLVKQSQVSEDFDGMACSALGEKDGGKPSESGGACPEEVVKIPEGDDGAIEGEREGADQTDHPSSPPATPRKNKENTELANLTKKFCMKQGEVLKSAEEVLSSASQLSEIQSHIDKLEEVLSTLERKVAGDSMSSFESEELFTPPPSPNSAMSLVSDDMESLHYDLNNLPGDVSSPSEVNMASAVRMITATALKVLSTTENVMDAHMDEDKNALSAPREIEESGPTDLTSPLSQTSTTSPSSTTGGMIFRVTSGKDSPPTATLLFTSAEGNPSNPPGRLLSVNSEGDNSEEESEFGSRQEVKGRTDGEEKETTVMVLDGTDLFIDDIITDGDPLGNQLEVSVFDRHFRNKNGIIDPLTSLYNQVTELEEKVYISAGKVYTLEERLLQLEQEVDMIDDSSAEEILAALEEKIALTVAQVSQNELEVSSVEDEIAGLESSPTGRVMSSVYSFDKTTPFKVSTATYFISNPDSHLGGLIEVSIPSDDLIVAMQSADPEGYRGPDPNWGTIVVHRQDNADEAGTFDWREVVETHGGNTETDENENGLKTGPGTDEVNTDSDDSEKYRSTYMMVVEPDNWREPPNVYESRVERPDE